MKPSDIMVGVDAVRVGREEEIVVVLSVIRSRHNIIPIPILILILIPILVPILVPTLFPNPTCSRGRGGGGVLMEEERGR